MTMPSVFISYNRASEVEQR